jgi:hypothetical protein
MSAVDNVRIDRFHTVRFLKYFRTTYPARTLTCARSPMVESNVSTAPAGSWSIVGACTDASAWMWTGVVLRPPVEATGLVGDGA